MANGTITLIRTGSGFLNGQILWESVSNGTQANTSTLTATLQIQRGAQNTTTGTFKGTFTVGGTSESISVFTALPSNTWVTLKTVTVTVSHHANGTGSCYLQARINGPAGTTMADTSVSGGETVTLDPIPRYAYFVTAPDFHDEEDPQITYANPVGNGAQTLEACISLDGSRDDVAYRSIPKTGSSYTFSLTEAERNTLRSATAEGNSRRLHFLIRTKLGDETGTNTLSRTFSIKNPEPTLNPVIRDVNSATTKLTGDSSTLIRYFSNASVTMNAAAVKGASLTSKKVTCGSKSRTSDGTIAGVESGKFVVKAKDSRGNTTVKNLEIPMVAYVKLTCRLSNDVIDGEGNMQIRAEGSCFAGSFGAASNTLQVSYRYKLQGDEYGSWQQMTVTSSGDTYTALADVTGLDYRRTYVFQTSAQDALSQATSVEKTVKALPVFEWGEADFRFRVPVSMAGNRITSLASPEETTDAVPLSYVSSLGLGAGGRHSEDLNNETTTGWYSFSDQCANAPFKYGMAMAVRRYAGDVVQVAFNPHMSSGNGKREICVRSCVSSVWGPWEYVNPPGVIGQAYRTVERYLGKAVYMKAVDFGVLPATDRKNVAYSTSAVTPISVTLVLSDGCVLGAGYGKDLAVSSSFGLNLNATKYNVCVRTEGDFSGLTGYAVVKYTIDSEASV